jgi:hypothetical protein
VMMARSYCHSLVDTIIPMIAGLIMLGTRKYDTPESACCVVY